MLISPFRGMCQPPTEPTMEEGIENGSERDAQIKTLAQNDPNQAHELLVISYRQKLVFHAYGIVKSLQDAEEIVSETFIRAMRQRNLFDPDFRIGAWLYRVTSNRSINFLRDHHRHAELVNKRYNELVPDEAESLEDLLLEEQRRLWMEARLECLSPVHREILLLRYWRDFSYVDIAEALNVPIGTVMSRLSRAHGKLRDNLTEDPETPAYV
ncbi:hypothetical protein COV05_01210 [Candidatus Uhrbacteria bacterium CG10_big_fil_rev_8_21_14_0_10_48_16]|uniref:RNA polymerase subunit sigma-24 n=1 Tax=Candidatus Uhrbacteria bacterium CG10_big_fil_rev_8_21_14_0_10_48_16 TaxID=1975038 RepID=A0A2M8LHV8_9BACT|nr:MAG: hypothetical protein COV05_01210 [Candidatus Uhrbacteria bacterium CG10_big_fil_rev_8_21_14_0_10_48_16]